MHYFTLEKIVLEDTKKADISSCEYIEDVTHSHNFCRVSPIKEK